MLRTLTVAAFALTALAAAPALAADSTPAKPKPVQADLTGTYKPNLQPGADSAIMNAIAPGTYCIYAKHKTLIGKHRFLSNKFPTHVDHCDDKSDHWIITTTDNGQYCLQNTETKKFLSTIKQWDYATATCHSTEQFEIAAFAESDDNGVSVGYCIGNKASKAWIHIDSGYDSECDLNELLHFEKAS